MSEPVPRRVEFPVGANYLFPVALLAVLGTVVYAMLLAGYVFSPRTTDVGYAPVQPVPFSHRLHAGELRMDCRYCHSTVEKSAFAALPTAAICMNCHASIATESEKLKLVRDSYATGAALSWKKVHDLPDYAYFHHGVHLSKGIGCSTCHGRIDTMDVVAQQETLSMTWCLHCHRNPERFVRPREAITTMDWDPESSIGRSQEELGPELVRNYRIPDIDSMTGCSKCHR